LLSTLDSIEHDEAITPEPRKRCNWMMVGGTLVPDRTSMVAALLDQYKSIVK